MRRIREEFSDRNCVKSRSLNFRVFVCYENQSNFIMAIISKLSPLLRTTNRVFHQSKRHGGHGGQIDVRTTNYMDQLAYDNFHFYSFLGFAPLFLFGGYMSVFVGDAILQDTPEGYEPEDWECERNPVRRLLARYIFAGKINLD